MSDALNVLPGMNRGILLAPEVDAYLMSLCPDSPRVLAEMEALAVQRGFPVVGPLVGRFLWQLACLKGARTVFEMGSGFGYSTAWFALAVGEGGRVVYTDTSPENCERAREFLGRMGLNDRVEYHIGEAVAALERLGGQYDLIMIDVEKIQYPRAFEVAAPHVIPGGMLVCDNVLWHGKVARDWENDDQTVAIREYNRLMFEHPDYLSTILPLRDGLGLSFRMR